MQGKLLLKLHPMVLLGGLAGSQTEAASMANILEESKSQTPVLGFSVCYAVSNVLLAVWGVDHRCAGVKTRKRLFSGRAEIMIKTHCATRPWRLPLMGLLASLLAVVPIAVRAGEGGVTHVQPGANATLADLPPTQPGSFFKPMFLNYRGSASAAIPTAAGLVADLSVTTNTLVLGGGYTFEQTVFGGAHYSVAAFVPYSWVDVSGVAGPQGGVRVHNSVSGLGDMTLVPVMLAWKVDEWQYDFLMPIYAPTGNYELGRLGNTGLNYWSFDPTVGVAYSNPKNGFNAMLHAGYAMNTENTATQYQSGSVLHIDAAAQQIVPVGQGLLTLGAEAFWFEQLSCDSGAGATLGCFKGVTGGLGPVLGYVLPMGKETLVLELKWLAELETQKRLNGDYLWLKLVYKF